MQRIREFRAPAEPLEKTLENNRPKRRYGAEGEVEGAVGGLEEGNSTFYLSCDEAQVSSPSTGKNTFTLTNVVSHSLSLQYVSGHHKVNTNYIFTEN